MSWFTQNIRDPIESIAPTAIGAYFGGPAGGAIAGQLAKPFEAKTAQASNLQKNVDLVDTGLAAYGMYQGLTGGNPWGWGSAGGAASGAGGAAGAGTGAATPSAATGAGVAPSTATAGAATTPAAATTTDYLTKYGPLAMYGVGQMGQIAQGQATAKAMSGVGAAQREQGQALLNQYKSGQINPGDQYAIEQWKSNALAQSRQYFAQSGQTDSSQAKAAEAQIEAQAVNMHQTALQSILQQGLSTLNVTDQYQAQAIQMELQNSQQALQNTTNFFNAYGQWLRQTPTMTGQAGAKTPAPAAAPA